MVFYVAFLLITSGEAIPSVFNVAHAKSIERSSLALAITKLSIPFPTGPVFLSFKTHFLMDPAESWN